MAKTQAQLEAERKAAEEEQLLREVREERKRIEQEAKADADALKRKFR